MSWLAVGFSAVVLLLAIIIGYRKLNSSCSRRLHRLERQLTGLAPASSPGKHRQWIKDLFSLIVCAAEQDEATAYKAIDLLQLGYGHGIVRTDEAVHITLLTATLLSQGHDSLAAAVLDVFRGLSRQLDHTELTIKQLQTIGVMAMRAKKSFVAAKALTILLMLFEKPERQQDPAVVTAAINTLKVLGRFAIRSRDTDLFRETVAQLQKFLAMSPNVESASLIGVFSVWLHAVVSKQNQLALTVLANCVQQLAEEKLISITVVAGTISEWRDLAGLAGLNPHSSMAAEIIQSMVMLGRQMESTVLWTNLVNAVMKVAYIVIEQFGVEYTFPLLQPLFEESRRMLVLELRFPLESEQAEFRQHALKRVFKECLAVADFAARLQMTVTTYEIIDGWYKQWAAIPELMPKTKSVHKLFQLLVLYWQKNLASQAQKQIPSQANLLSPLLLTPIEINQFGFMRR